MLCWVMLDCVSVDWFGLGSVSFGGLVLVRFFRLSWVLVGQFGLVCVMLFWVVLSWGRLVCFGLCYVG